VKARVRTLVWGCAVLTMGMPVVAAAQPATAVARVSLGAGAGVAVPFHGDFDFTAWAWEADLRLALSPRLIFEVAAGDWRHTETRTATNIQTTPPPGVIGRLEQTTSRVQRSWQANMLLAGGFGRVRLTGGGGVGFLQHNRRTETTTEDCSLGASCGTFASSFSNVSGAAQAVGGAEVRMTGTVAIYGQARLIVPMTDPGGSDLRITGGLRWGF
jgi:hypothetical protein